MALSLLVWDSLGIPRMQALMTETKKEPAGARPAPKPRPATTAAEPRPATTAAEPRPATTVLLVRPSKPGDMASPLEVFMVVRHHQIDAFSGALVFPGGKLEDADGDPRLRARCGGAQARSDGANRIGDGELKFRIAGVREAFEECGILLARKRGQRAVIAAADLLAIEKKWRARLAKDEASIVDLVEAEDLELATDLMVPFAHWITPTFAPRRFDTWFFLAEAPQDQIALHDGSELVELGVDRRAGRDRRGHRRPPHPGPRHDQEPRAARRRQDRHRRDLARRPNARSSRSSPGSRTGTANASCTSRRMPAIATW